MSKTNVLLTVVAVGVTANMVGCEPQETLTPDEQATLEENVNAEVRAKMAEDEKELQQIREELQKADPTVKDAYYAVGEGGERELRIVKESADDNGSVTESIWPLLAGAGAGFLLAQAMSNAGGVGAYSQHHHPRSYSSYDEEERRRRRNMATSTYSSHLLHQTRTRAALPGPSGKPAGLSPNWSSRPNANSPAIQSRVNAVFAPSTSARAGSHATSTSFGG